MNIRQLSIKLGVLLCWICLNGVAQPATAKKPILDIQYWQTSQGTPVYFVRAPELPMIDLQIIFTAGSSYDADQWGLASIVASMLNEGSKLHNADQIADAFDQTGAQFSSLANRDFTMVALRSLTDPKYFTPTMHMFSEVLSQANFPDKALVRVKQQTLASIRQSQQNPSSVAADAFYKNLYPNHPYGHTPLGTEQTVNAITRNQLQTFYQRFFVSANAKIILVGALSRSQAEQIAEQLMSALPKGAPAPALTVSDSHPASGVQTIDFPSQQTTIMSGQLGIDRRSSQYFPLMVGNYLLGVMPLDSLLFEQVRNQHGLAYDISSGFVPMTYRGPFLIVLQTRTAEKKQAYDIIQQVLRQYVEQGPTPKQLQAAKQNIIHHFPLNLSTNDQIASVLTQIAINQRPLDYLDTYRDKVNAVTTQQVSQAFQGLIHPDNMLTVMVGSSQPSLKKT